MTRPTAPLMIVLLLAAAFAACAEASGEIRGHDETIDTSPSTFFNCDTTEQLDAGDGTGWSDLYRDLFSPTGSAKCGKPECHGSAQGRGVDRLECIDQAGCRNSVQANLLRPSDQENPENSGLIAVLKRCDDDRNRVGQMPLEPTSYVFSKKSLARIKTWIAAGAPDN